MAGTMRDYALNAQLSMAAYGTFDLSINSNVVLYLEALRDADVGMSESQARAFIGIDENNQTIVDEGGQRIAGFEIIHHHPDDNSDGFSATVFLSRETGEYYFAIRGTDPTDLFTDWVTNAQALFSGAARNQVVRLINYYLQLTTPQSSQANQVRLVWDDIDGTYHYEKYLVNGLGTLVKAGNALNVTGHSLGGHLASALNKAFPQLNTATSETYTYNGLGIGTGMDSFLNELAPLYGISPDTTTLNADFDVENVIAEPGWDVAPNAFAASAQLGNTDLVFIEEQPLQIPNHSISHLADSMAVYDLLATVDRSLAIETGTTILEAASNNAEASLETIVTAIGKLLDPTFTSDDRLGDNVVVPVGDRERLYTNIEKIREHLGATSILSLTSLVGMGAALAQQAIPDTDLGEATRYALVHLNPFVITGDPGLYANHNTNGELSLFTPPSSSNPNSSGTLTQQYLEDRAKLLNIQLDINTHDTPVSEYYSQIDEGEYIDRTTELHVNNFDQSGVQPEGYTYTRYVFGTDGADTGGAALKGALFGVQVDHLYGGGGNDTLEGRGGNDYLEGGVGNDTYVYSTGDGIDTIVDIDGLGSIVVDGKTLTGGAQIAENLWRSGDGKHTYALDGDPDNGGTLIIDGKLRVQHFRNGQLGITLDDEVTPTPKQHELTGTAGNDLRYDGHLFATADELEAHLQDSVHAEGLGGNDWIGTLYGDDRIDGGAGNDWIVSYEGDDVVAGGSEDDAIFTAQGEDIVDAGDGNDLVVDSRYLGFTVTEAGSGLTVPSLHELVWQDAGWQFAIDGASELALNQQGEMDFTYCLLPPRTAFVGTSTDSQAMPFEYVPGAGESGVITYQSGSLQGAYTLGSSRTDSSDSGANWFSGGAGDDLLIGNAGADTLLGGADNDRLAGSYGADVLLGGAGDDELLGQQGNDHIDGGADHDTAYGGSGRDTLYGGTGNDELHGDNGDDGAGAEDYLFGESGDDRLFGEGGDDVLYGGSGDDELNGGGGNDQLYGGAGNDHLRGGAGNDVLIGGLGDNTLEGGAGTDTFVVQGQSGHAVIADADGSDTVAINGVDFASMAATVGGGSDGTASLDLTLSPTASLRIAGGITGAVLNYQLGGQGLTSAELINTYMTQAQDFTLSGSGEAWLGSGDDRLIGSDGDDHLHAQGGNDLLVGGAGADHLYGGEGVDRYRIGLGSGRDVIEEVPGEASILELAPGVGIDELSYQRIGSDLVVNLPGAIDGAVLRGFFEHQQTWTLEDATGGSFTLDTTTASHLVGFNIAGTVGEIQAGFSDWVQEYYVGALHASGYHKVSDGEYQKENIGTFNDIDGNGVLHSTYRVSFDTAIETPTGSLYERTLPATSETFIGESVQIELGVRHKYRDYEANQQIVDVRFGETDDTFRFQHTGYGAFSLVDGGAGNDTLDAGLKDTSKHAYSNPGVVTVPGSDWVDAEYMPGSLLWGSEGNDQLYGSVGMDVLLGGDGDDYMFGGMGGDVYRVQSLSGMDTLFEDGWEDTPESGIDTLVLPEGITASDLSYSLGTTMASSLYMPESAYERVWSEHTTVSLNWTDEDGVTIVLPHSDQRAGLGLDYVAFADGERLSFAGLLDAAGVAPEVDAHSDEDVLMGSGIVYGGAGDDVLTTVSVGGPPSPPTHGALSTVDAVLVGGEGRDTLIGSDSDDLLLGGSLIEDFSLDFRRFVTGLSDEGNVFQGAGGNDTVWATAGSDVFLFNAGDGNDRITDMYHDGLVGDWRDADSLDPAIREQLLSGSDVLRFGDSISSSDIEVQSVENDLIFRHNNGQDAVVFEQWDGAAINQLTRVEFYDGSYWNTDDIVTMLGGGSANAQPVATGSVQDQTATANTLFELTLPMDLFTDPEGTDINYDIVAANGGDLPTWLHFDAASATLSGTPPDITGELQLSVVATDAQGKASQLNFVLTITEADDHTLIGGDGADALVGTANADFLYGNGGDDSLEGGDGDDLLDGGDGNDVLNGGRGNDELEGGSGEDTYLFNLGDGIDVIHDSGINTLRFGPGIDVDDLRLGLGSLEIAISDMGDAIHIAGFDSDNPYESTGITRFEFADGTVLSYKQLIDMGFDLVGSAGGDVIRGTGAVDRVHGHGGDDELIGLGGDDLLDGGAGIDAMSGGEGDDTYVVDNASDVVFEHANEGADAVLSSVSYVTPEHVESLTLTGSGDTDAIGNALENVLTGNAGSNTFDGASGSDTMAGGAGNDTYVVDNAGDIVTELGDQGIDSILSSVSYVLPEHVESLRLLGETDINASGNDTDNLLIGNAGDNDIAGGAGNDQLDGAAGNDSLEGGAGDDTLHGELGDDALAGGAGDDTYIYSVDGGLDAIIDSAGTDTVRFGEGLSLNNVALRLVERDGEHFAQVRVLDAGGCEQSDQGFDFAVSVDRWGCITSPIERFEFADGGTGTLDDLLIEQQIWRNSPWEREIVAGRDDDIIFGGSRANTIHAGSGHDLVYAGARNDSLYGEGGDDYLQGNSGHDLLDGGCGTDVLSGGNGRDVLRDQSGNNALFGGLHEDTIKGGKGNDFIAGGRHDDMLSGGGGANVFAFNRHDGRDTVLSSEGERNTLSLGGGIDFKDLELRRDGDDLILETGRRDQVTFADWYSGETQQNFATLQLIDERWGWRRRCGGGFNHRVESFDFQALVGEFDTAMAANQGQSRWKLMNGLLNSHLSSGEDAAMGGDLALDYANSGRDRFLNPDVAQETLRDARFGNQAQSGSDRFNGGLVCIR